MRDLILRFCRWALPLLGVSAAISCDNVIQAPEDQIERQDTTWTSEKGEFVVQQSSFPSDKMILKFTDVDGSENGEYSVEQVEVSLVLKEESQDGWMVGIYTADDVQVELDPVADEEE